MGLRKVLWRPIQAVLNLGRRPIAEPQHVRRVFMCGTPILESGGTIIASTGNVVTIVRGVQPEKFDTPDP